MENGERKRAKTRERERKREGDGERERERKLATLVRRWQKWSLDFNVAYLIKSKSLPNLVKAVAYGRKGGVRAQLNTEEE